MKNKRGKRYLPLKWELALALVPVLVVAVVAIQFVVYLIARQEMIDSSDRLLASDASTMSAKVQAWSGQVAAQLDLLASLIEGGELENADEIAVYLQHHAPGIAYCENGIYVVYDRDGTYLETGERGVNPDYLAQDWYRFGIGNERAAFDSCSYFEEDGETGYSVTVIRQFCENGVPAGVIAADAYLEGITSLLMETLGTESEQALLLDGKSGMVIGATQTQYQGQTRETADSFVGALLRDMEAGSFSHRYEGSEDTLFTAAVPVAGTEWYMVTYLPRQVALSRLELILNASVAGGCILVVLIALRVLQVATRSMKPLAAAKDVLLRMTAGDFTVAIPPNKRRRSNEISEINENLSGFLDKMRKLLHDVDITSVKLSEHSQEFSVMAEELNRDAGTQMESVGNLTANMEQIAESIQQLALHAGDLSSLAADTRENSQRASGRMELTMESAHNTREHMDTIASSVYSTGEAMDTLAGLVDKMQVSTAQIQMITEVIMDIATQTNLLSLNASIEAARAGKEGRGFAIVAGEIKRLAESSEQNAQQIEEHIAGITSLIHTTAESASRSVEEVRSSVELMRQLEGEMNQVTAAVEETGMLLKEMSVNVENVAEISTSIAAISEEQAAGSQEVAASAEQINSLVENTKEKSDALQGGTEVLHLASEDLRGHMESFQL